MKKHILLLLLLMINYSLINAQYNYIIKSKDGVVTATNFIGFGEGIDSVIVKNKSCKIKFSHHTPLFNINNDNDDSTFITNTITIQSIKKIKNKFYLLVGVGTRNWETQLNLIFIKKNKILKYYTVKSDDRTLRDVTFKYLPKTKEVIIPIPKEYTHDYIYEIDLKENKLDSIKALDEKIHDKFFYKYKLKIK